MSTLGHTWLHIRRSPYQALAAISIMLLTFTAGGIFLLVSLASAITLKHFEQKPQLIVFFKDNKKESDIISLADQLKKSDQIATVKYVSKEDALNIYEQQFKNDPLLLEMVSADILPASLEISTKELTYLPDLAKTLKEQTDIQDILFPEDVVKMLISWTGTIRTAGIIIVVFLGCVSLLTVVTVISMKIALRREEIEILQLVGATSWYIRRPFIIEGLFYGIIGSVIGWGINIVLLIYATPTLSQVFKGIPIFPITAEFYGIFLAGQVVAGSILGMLASSMAINRYLK